MKKQNTETQALYAHRQLRRKKKDRKFAEEKMQLFTLGRHPRLRNKVFIDYAGGKNKIPSKNSRFYMILSKGLLQNDLLTKKTGDNKKGILSENESRRKTRCYKKTAKCSSRQMGSIQIMLLKTCKYEGLYTWGGVKYRRDGQISINEKN